MFGNKCTLWRKMLMAGPALGVMMAPAALAQDDSESDTTARMSTITVTATKRDVALQDIPASASVVSGEQAELLGLDDVQSLVTKIPNLAYGEHDGATYVTIRGVGATVDTGIGEPSVATYIDGVFLPRQTMGFLSQADLDRVEVIRGPQGTLYGRNATGGAINFITKAPSETFEGSARIGTGSFDAFNVGGHISGPINDAVRFRLSAGYDTNEGYVDNLLTGDTIGGRDLTSVRGAIQADLTPKTVLDAFVQYQETDGKTAWQQPLLPSQSPLLPPGYQETIEPNKIIAEGPYESAEETLIASVAITHEFSDSLSLKSQTSYIEHDSLASLDGDVTDYGLVDVEGFVRPSISLAQEFILNGVNGNLDWLVGAFYFQEDFKTILPAPLPNGVPGLAPPGTINYQVLNEETTSYAIFADFELGITDRLSLLGGARMNWEEKDFRQTIGAIIPGAGFFGVMEVPSQREDEEFLPKIGLSYDITEDFLTYVQYQKGLKSGGQNLALSQLYEPEILDSYEAGFRSTWSGGDSVLNGAFFIYDYTDLQVVDLPGGTTTVVFNADAEIRGLELEYFGQLTDELRVTGGVTYLDSEYTDFTALDFGNVAAGVQDLSGGQLNRAPEFTINGSVQYTFPVADGLTVSGDVFHSDDVVLRYFGTANDTQEAYTVLNVTAALNLNGGNLQLKAFGRNIGDEVYLRQILFSPLSGTYFGNYAPGANWGVEAVVRF